nr:SGNH/GDSL hydrolase family protein [Lactobacillus sp. S2-2]
MLTIGDSITNGFNGEVDLHKNYPFFLKKLLNLKEIDNHGVNAGMISGFSERDLTYQVKITDFSSYDIVSIAYGTNDYSHSDCFLNDIKRTLQNNLKLIKQNNPNLIIIGILPINRFDNHTFIDQQLNSVDYSYHELLDEISKVYQSFNIPVLNWRKVAPNFLTVDNYQEKLNDQRLHPNQSTYYEMAQIIANFIKGI